MAERIAYLERLLWGGKRDRRVAQGPTLFDAFFNEAAESKDAAIASTVREIRKEAEKRRAGSGKKPARPERYLYAGLPEEWRTEYPQGVNLAEYDIIGKEVTRILHRSPARICTSSARPMKGLWTMQSYIHSWEAAKSPMSIRSNGWNTHLPAYTRASQRTNSQSYCLTLQLYLKHAEFRMDTFIWLNLCGQMNEPYKNSLGCNACHTGHYSLNQCLRHS